MSRAATLVAACLAAAAAHVVLAPAEAMAECDALHGPCPGIVCLGQGDDHGYRACVGPGYCDPAACDPWEGLP